MKTTQPATQGGQPNRIESIDQFRGFAILGMVIANYLAGIKSVPAWLKHAPDIGLTVIDLVAPFFIFAIGLNFGLSWHKRLARDGKLKALQHFITRFLALVGIGAILSAGEIWLEIDGATINWGVLQAIGCAGLLTLMLINLPTRWRLYSGLALLAVYQFLLNQYWLANVLKSPHGGMPGALGWSSMLILATVCGDILHSARENKQKRFVLSCLGWLAAGLVISLWFPISKNRVSGSYVLVTLGISGLVFAVFHWFKLRVPVLTAWGKNPLVLYVLHLLLLGLMVLPGVPGWYSAAPVRLVVLQLPGLLCCISLAALWLERRGMVLGL